MPISRKALDNKKKLEILDEILSHERNGKVNFTKIGRKFDIDRTTVARISKSRETLKEITASGNFSLKRMRRFKKEDVDSALFIWVRCKLQQDVRLNQAILKTKAIELAHEMGHAFIPSDGWINRFKERHNIKFKKEYGEKEATDLAVAKNFKQHILPRLLQQYEKQDIFNADETGLYFKGLPVPGYAMASENLSEGEKAKERVTVLVCANMTGTEKRKLKVIGKCKHPSCFPRDALTLPVSYDHSPNAWMTGGIFGEHVEEWNESLKFQGRKILLFIDKCSAHPPTMSFSNIEIFFLPQTTSIIQPMELGVIRNLKCHYRRLLNERITAELDANESNKAVEVVKRINLSDAIYMLDEAWAEVKGQTIRNCFAKAGFKDGGDTIDDLQTEEDLMLPPDNLSAEEFNAMVCQDDNLEVCNFFTDTIISPEAKRIKFETTDSHEEREEEPFIEPSKQELLASVNTMRRFLQHRGENSLMPYFRTMEREVFQALHEEKTQVKVYATFAITIGSQQVSKDGSL